MRVLYALVWFDTADPCSRIQTQHNKPYHTTSKRYSNGDDCKLHRSGEIGARNVDMHLDVDALLGVRLMIAREVDDSDDGLPQVSAWRGGGVLDGTSCRSSRAML